MGVCFGKISEEGKTNATIERSLRKGKKTLESDVRLLLLGAGESGKTTIMKQMRLIHASGFNTQTRLEYRRDVYQNTLGSMQSILKAMEPEKLDIPLSDPSNEKYKKMVQEYTLPPNSEDFDGAIFSAIKILYKDEGVRSCMDRSSSFQLLDSASYFLDAVDRISAPSYIPDNQDILRIRQKTTGIEEFDFKIRDLNYRMIDVGGQRSERKKWIRCFEDVTAIIFLVAISEYDQVLAEDESTNRIQEALTLFDAICNSKWFVNTSIILFLNKTDLFKEKIKRVPLERTFPDYKGGPDFEAGCKYLTDMFIKRNKSKKKTIYPHLTCGTDTSQIKFVMNAVTAIIRDNLLREARLI